MTMEKINTPLGELQELLKPIKMIRITDDEDGEALIYYEAKEVDAIIESLLQPELEVIEKAFDAGYETLGSSMTYNESLEKFTFNFKNYEDTNNGTN